MSMSKESDAVVELDLPPQNSHSQLGESGTLLELGYELVQPSIAREMDTDSKDEIEKMNITQLPREILEKIGDHLDSESSLALRLTCPVLKELIDTYVGVNMKIVDNPSQVYTKKQLNFIGKTVLNHITSTDILGKDEDNKGMRSYLKKNHFFDDIFHFPHSLRSIAFDGSTDAIFVYDVLTKCHNLKNIYFCNGVKFEGDLVALLIKEDKKEEFKIKSRERSTWLSVLSHRDDIFRKICFKKVEWLYFDYRSVIPMRDNDLLNIVLLLKCVRSKAIKRMFLMLPQIKDLTEIEYFNFSMIVAEFIEDHVETLKDMSFGMSPPEDRQEFSNSNEEHVISSLFNEHVQLEPNEIQGDGDLVAQKIQMILTLRQKLESIGKISKLTFLAIQMPPNFHWDCWLLFIESLQKLITLHIMVSTKYRILKNCEFLRNKGKSLKRLRMHLDMMNSFDFSGVEQCEKLEEVYLFNRTVSSVFITQGPSEAHVLNVKLLPPGLKALTLGNVVVASDDLNIMLSNQKRLDTLVIMNMPTVNPENSTDCKCIKKILRMRYLQSCLIENIRCKTKKTYDRVSEMLDFQKTPKDRALIEQVNQVMSRSPQIMAPFFLDVVSEDVYRRYMWEQNFFSGGLLSHYSLKFNDSDPYL